MKVTKNTGELIESLDARAVSVLKLINKEGNILLIPSNQDGDILSRTIRDAPPNEERIRGIA